jgi:hypothetical protein
MLKMKIISRYAHTETLTHNIYKKQTQAQTLRINNETKFLYKKKQQLSKELYYIHTENVDTWNNIQQSINQKLQNEIKIIHENNNNKRATCLNKNNTTEGTKITLQ